MKHILNYLIIAAAIFCYVVPVMGQEHKYMLNVNDFTELKLLNNINVEYKSSTDTVAKAFFTCSNDVTSRLLFSQDPEGKKLKIEVDTIMDGLPTIYLYSTKLEKVENTSDSTIFIHGIGEIEEFDAKVVGNGTLVMNNIVATTADITINTGRGNIIINSGDVTSVKYKNVGKGIIDATALTAKKANVILLGTGDVECSVEQSLSIYGSGSGTVRYKGNPEKITNRSIGVKNEKIQ